MTAEKKVKKVKKVNPYGIDMWDTRDMEEVGSHIKKYLEEIAEDIETDKGRMQRAFKCSRPWSYAADFDQESNRYYYKCTLNWGDSYRWGYENRDRFVRVRIYKERHNRADGSDWVLIFKRDYDVDQLYIRERKEEDEI